MHKDVSFEKAYALAVGIVKCCQEVRKTKGEVVLSGQLLRSGTSIAANLAEGHAAISDADLSSKISISYKESRETKYWLKLMVDTGYLKPSQAEPLLAQADEISRIIFASIRTLRLRKTRPASANE